MSLNLTLECTETGVTHKLWQTPTYITDMCLYPSSSTKEDIFHRYSFWVRSQLNGVWKNAEDRRLLALDVQEHLESVEKFLENHPKAKFSYC